VNEYYAVEKLDPTKLPFLQQQIWELVERTNLKADLDTKTMLTRERGDHTHEWDDSLTPEGIPTTLASMTGNEVAHLIEMNHSRRFWRLLKRLCPDMQRAKIWLDVHGTDLHRYGETENGARLPRGLRGRKFNNRDF